MTTPAVSQSAPMELGAGTGAEHGHSTAAAAGADGWPSRMAGLLALVDIVLIAIAILVAHLSRFGVQGVGARIPATEIAQAWLGVVLALGWLLALGALRTREPRVIGVGLLEYRRVANATLATIGFLAVVAFFSKLEIARGYLAIALPAGLLLLLLGRFGMRKLLLRLRREDRCLFNAVVIGSSADVRRVVGQLRRNLGAGYRPIAVSVTDSSGVDVGLPNVPLSEVVGMSRSQGNRAVLIAGDLPGGREQIRDLSWSLEDSHVELILVSSLTDVAGPRMQLRPVEGLPLVHVDLPQYSGVHHLEKRLFDIVGSAVALILLAPVFALLALAVRLESPGPILFRQERVGVGGRRFTMFKFRSMGVDAEQRLNDLAALNEAAGPLFKLRNDPRVTRVGAFIRTYSLDELPQFWNVLTGDMSLVGPRPPLPREVEQYEGPVHRRLLTKPGITGLWQVSGRSRLSWEESVELDLYYVENWSLMGDFLILLRTARAVLQRDGAY